MGFAILTGLMALSLFAGAAILACCMIAGIVDRDTFPTTQPELGE